MDLATFTLFHGHQAAASGPLDAVLPTALAAVGPALLFDDRDGRVVDLDPRESLEQAIRRLAPARGTVDAGESAPRGRGRPKLGVVAREVTLLPRHWEWLGAQPGGASVALRRLVDEARRTSADVQTVRSRRDAAYRFMSALAGDLPGFEEATRALFAGDRARFIVQIARWPADVRDYAIRLAFGGNGDA